MKIIRYFIICLAVCFSYGISFANPFEIARVDDVVIQDTDFLNRVKLLSGQEKAKLDKEKFLNKMIDEELILRAAQRLNLHDDEDYKIRVETYKRELLVDLYLQKYLKEKNTEDNQKKFYEENKAKYTSPEAARISVIQLKSEEQAKEISEKVRAGEDFAELAKKNSKGPAAQKGGDFGFRSRDSMRKQFAEFAFSAKLGEVSGPIRAEDGFYLVKVTDRRAEGIATFEEVQKRVANEHARKLLEDKISELRKNAQIKISPDEFKNLIIK